MEVYDPESTPQNTYLKLWGTRGSVPVSGAHHTRFGGNTACLEIRRANHEIIIDAGTGIRALGDELLTTKFREIHLIIGHNHWDHVIGFPFFQPLYRSDFVVHIYGPTHYGKNTEAALQQILEPHHFPVRLDELKCTLHFHEVAPGDTIGIGDVKIDTCACDHPGGALGFRIHQPGHSLAYMTDNEFLKGYRGHPNQITLDSEALAPYRDFVEFVRGADLLIHEAQYTPREYAARIGWGHTSMSNAAALLRLAGIREWVVTHHDPAATDDRLRSRLQLMWQILRECGTHCHVSMASDGMKLLL